MAILPSSIGNLKQLTSLFLESNLLPVEFMIEYIGYKEVQQFLVPFQNEWIATHEPISQGSGSQEISNEGVQDELLKAFNAMEDLL